MYSQSFILLLETKKTVNDQSIQLLLEEFGHSPGIKYDKYDK